MIRYLIDTNILSEPLKPKPNSQVVCLMKQHTQQIAIASITWHEILFGYHRLTASRRKEKIARYIQSAADNFPILPYSKSAAAWHAQERARLTRIGNTPSFPDAQIAAIAAIHHLIVVTRNTNDFESFQGVPTENWFQNSTQ